MDKMDDRGLISAAWWSLAGKERRFGPVLLSTTTDDDAHWASHCFQTAAGWSVQVEGDISDTLRIPGQGGHWKCSIRNLSSLMLAACSWCHQSLHKCVFLPRATGWWATKTTGLSIRGDEQPWSSESAAQELQRQWKYSRGPMSLKQINQESDWRPPSVKKNNQTS